MLDLVSKSLGEVLDGEFKLPKTHKNYKGADIVEEIDITSVLGNRGSSVDMESQRFSLVRSSNVGAGGERAISRPTLTASTSARIMGGISYCTPEEQAKWSPLLISGESVLVTGLVGKRNPMGLTQSRQLILTSTPRLLYADPQTMSLKGEVENVPGQSITASAVIL